MHESSNVVRMRSAIDPTSSNVYGEILKRVFLDALREEMHRSTEGKIYDWAILNLIMMNNWELPISCSSFYSTLGEFEHMGVIEYDQDECIITVKDSSMVYRQ